MVKVNHALSNSALILGTAQRRCEEEKKQRGVGCLPFFLLMFFTALSLRAHALHYLNSRNRLTETRPTTEVACLSLSRSENGRKKGSERGKGGAKRHVFPE